MINLSIDFESASAVDLSIVGLDNYVTDKSTVVLMMAYAFEDESVQLWEPHKEKFPDRVLKALYDPEIIVWGWNVNFERQILAYCLGHELPYVKFKDSMVLARYMALPGSLDECGVVLNIDASVRKMDNSDRLKNMFCFPAKEGGEETLFGISQPVFRNWETNPKEWQEFCEYCRRDVIAERAIKNRLKNFPLPDHEWEAWYLDQEINERGVMTDTKLIEGGSYIASLEKSNLIDEMYEITKLDNPNSVSQLLGWLRERRYPFHELGKPFVMRALSEQNDMTEEARTVLKIRQQSGKTSAQKLINIANQVSNDGRLRFQYSFLGASRTGRWSSGSGE